MQARRRRLRSLHDSPGLHRPGRRGSHLFRAGDRCGKQHRPEPRDPLLHRRHHPARHRSIDAGPSGTTTDSTPSFEFHSTEAGSSFECSIDTGVAAFGPCSGPGATHTPAALADGSYTFRVRATDGAANTDPEPRDPLLHRRHHRRPTRSSTPAPAGTTTDTDPELRLPLHRGGLELRMLDRHRRRRLRALLGTGRQPHPGGARRRLLHLPGPGHRRRRQHRPEPRDPLLHRRHHRRPRRRSTPAPPGTTNDPTPSFEFHSSEAGSSFECSLDTGAAGLRALLGTGRHPHAGGAAPTAPTPSGSGPPTAPPTPTRAPRPAPSPSTPPRPTTTIDAGPTGTTTDPTPSFEFHSSEAGSSFECSIDTGVAGLRALLGTGRHPHPGGAADGSYTFRVRATDGAANTDQSPATRSFTVDTTAARHDRSTPAPPAPPTTPTPSFEFHSTEAGSSFECSIDTGVAGLRALLGTGRHPHARRRSPTAPTPSGSGPPTAPPTPTRAPRPAPSRSTPPPPDTIDRRRPPGTTADPTPSFEFHSTESGSSFECSIDTGVAAFGPCSGPGATHTPAALSDGSYTFRVRATDGAANTDQSPATRSFTVDTTSDTTPPETTIDAGPADGSSTNDNDPSFAFSSSEPGSSFECKIDAGAPPSGPARDRAPATTTRRWPTASYTFSGAGHRRAPPTPTRAPRPAPSRSTPRRPTRRSTPAPPAPPTTRPRASNSTPPSRARASNARSTPASRPSGPARDRAPPTPRRRSPTAPTPSGSGPPTAPPTPTRAPRPAPSRSTPPPPHTDTGHGEAPKCKTGFKKQKHHGKTKCVKIKKPRYGKFAVIAPVHGKVLIKVPGGKGFVRLTDDDQIPLGTIIDTTQGRVRLTCAKSRQGDGTETADFYDGVFRVEQPAIGQTYN